mmetsp:Transcript_286/g.853  ORF Transcript_286/g.853 Transcript_286/m.853 type:complete len:767 (-) Transcript_286:217-2517(-)
MSLPKKDPECVKVCVRCRPLSSKEVEEQRVRTVDMDCKRGEVYVKNPAADERDMPKAFTFDHVFDWNSTQEEVFNGVALPIVESVLQGYNGTIFAYGQTGTGKTHTMSGPNLGEHRGIIPRAFSHVFTYIGSTDAEQYLVRASFLEIYNEEVRDLLSKDPKNKLELKEDVERGVYVKDLTSYVVKGVSELEHVMAAGNKNRSVGATLMNQDSSRSHSIFCIVVESTADHPDGSRHIRVGKLNLTDLAGSERQSKTGATGERLKEATKINLSLSALGNVISSLVDSKSTYVPYRDSKLTRLLQDSLGGNTKTVMVANLGPADYNYDETISTLRYANRAKNIKNKPKINEDPKDAMLREFQEEIQRLRAQLEAGGGGGEDGGGGGGGGGGRKKAALSEEELEALRAETEAEVQAIKAAKDMTEAQKVAMEEKLAEELAEKQRVHDELETERRNKEELARKLASIEDKLLEGGGEESLKEKNKQQLEALAKAQQEIENRKAEEMRLERELAEKEEEQLMAEEKFSSIEAECASKTKKMKKLWSKWQAAKEEIHDLQQEFQQEREDLLETIREQDRQLKLQAVIITNFIPPEEYRKVERRARWDEDTGDWTVERVAEKATNVKRPVSAAGTKRPTSAVARAANRLGSENPRFKGENVLGMELDLPDRTTRDYEERDFFEDGGGLGFSMGSSGNVYLYPGPGDDDMERPKSRSSRSASGSAASKARPTSAKRKSKTDKEKQQELLHNVPLDDDQAEAYPKARGLVSSSRRF